MSLHHYAAKTYRRVMRKPYRTLNRIELNAAHMHRNIALIQSRHPDFQIIPVLKGNAYGHGITQVAEILGRVPVSMLAVDGYFEARQVHQVTNCHVLVMGHILPQNFRMLDLRRCSFVVQDIAGLQAFGALRRPVRIHLELNTGMNRLGLAPAELGPYLTTFKQFPNLELEGIMTHLADADNPDDSFNQGQVAAFETQVEAIIAAGFRPRLIHIAQTAGSPKVTSRYANALRLGIGTYGINPLLPDDPHFPELQALQPVLELKSTIIKVLNLEAGARVSYNGIFTAHRAMRAGVLPLGFYEGVPRELSGRGCVTHSGRALPILGRVCMDHTIIDLTGTKLGVNDEVTVISSDPARPNSLKALQANHDLFPYTVLTGLSSSVRREIV